MTLNLTTLSDSFTTQFPLHLETYQAYSPCVLILYDPDPYNSTEGSGTNVYSNEFWISNTNNSAGQTWSIHNKAPAAGIELNPNADSAAVHSQVVGGVGTYMMSLGAVAVMLSLL